MDDWSVGDVLERLARGMVAITARSIAGIDGDLTLPQWRVLVVVGENPDGVSISELAERTGAALSPVSRIVDRMARRGWVRRVKTGDDRRMTFVVPTPEGLVIRDDVISKRAVYLAELATALGAISMADADVLERLADAVMRFA